MKPFAVGMVAVVVGLGSGCTAQPLSTEHHLEGELPSPTGVVTGSCDDDELEHCVVGRCRLSAMHGTLGPGVSVELTEKPVPPELNGDALGTVMCDVVVPAGASAELTLGIDTGTPIAGAALFRYPPPEAPALIAASVARASSVEGLIQRGGTYGVTMRSAAWKVDAVLESDPRSSADLPSLLRNVSGGAISAATYDGTRLYVASGGRLLIYNGVPSSPAVKPAIVLGQPELDSSVTGVSSALFGSGIQAVWSNGTKLAVATGNRVLLWLTIPTASFAPADVVLGQPDFSTSSSNTGGVSASSLSSPYSLDSDGTRLLVADMRNNRVLAWDTFPIALGQPATTVLGQPSFTSADVSAGAMNIYQARSAMLMPDGALVASFFSGVFHVPSIATNNAAPDFSPLAYRPAVQPGTVANPSAVARTPLGGLALADHSANRISMFRALPSAPTSVDFVLGQPYATRTVSSQPVTASSLGGPQFLGSTASLFMVPDGARLLVFDAPPTYTYEPASRVIGQAGFTTSEIGVDYRGTSARTLAAPADVAVSGDTVAVADRGNNRVLLYPAAALATPGSAATVVLGQPDATSFVPNLDQVTPNAARLSGPAGVALDGTHLIVADTENHRVLIWNTVPTATGTPASIVLGQADFVGRRPNRGRGDVSPLDGFSDAGADGFFYPTAVASDGTHLFVADRLNHRVLSWSTFPTTSGQAADGVIGQPSFTSLVPNRGNGAYRPHPDGFNLPTGVTLVGSTLWVADTENNRVVRIEQATTAPSAAAYVGQPDGSTLANLDVYPESSYNAGYPWLPASTSAASVLRPRAVAVANGRLYVSETQSNRVHIFDASSFTSLGELGQTLDTSGVLNANGLGPASLASPMGIAADATRLLVAEGANHRVVAYGLTTPPATGAAATAVLGQSGFSYNGFNQSTPPSAGGASRPRGLALHAGELYVAESDHHRVFVVDAPFAAGASHKRVYGQPDDLLLLPNAGGAPSARTLSNPRGVAVDAQHVVIADTGNSRVLVFDRTSPSPDAVLVLGQPDFQSVQQNRGGAATAATLRAPEGALIDGGRLFVADTANHRVLVWTSFPTASGQPADLVLGQVTAADALSNRGDATASATSLSSPTAVDVARGSLFVADSGNNRVLRFASVPTANGAAADSVLGQADLVSRVTTANQADLDHLAGPVGLADDGTNLYVVDRDLGRVVSYALPATSSGQPGAMFIGARGGLVLTGPGGIVAEKTSFFASRVYVADTSANRVVTLGGVTRLAAE